MQPTPFKNLVKHLTDDQTPRVWSLLLTVFGELVQDQGAHISGLLLRQISERIGIKPEAMRVAIHRLRKDGWIDSKRNGRTSSYFLTDWGRAQSAQASPRIYATTPAADQAWLVISPTGQPQNIENTSASIASNIHITSLPPTTPDTFTTALTADTPLPNWMRHKVCHEQTVTLSQDFAQALDNLHARLQSAPSLTTLESTALRVLLVHSWRRIVLKAPILPDDVFPTGWCGPVCRQRVSTLLARYPKQQLRDLEAAIAAA